VGRGGTCEARGTMRAKTPTMETYMRSLTLLRSAKSRDQYKYSPGGRERRRTRLSLLKTPKAKEILEFFRHSEF
jgi:hypothetical protein